MDYSEFKFIINQNMQEADNLIKQFLQAYEFKVYDNTYTNERYYRSYDQLVGARGFNYQINGNLLTIIAWVDTKKKKYPLTDGNMIASFPKNSYLKVLKPLLEHLESIANNNVNAGQNVNGNQNQGSNVSSSVSSIDSSIDNSLKKYNKTSTTLFNVGFVLTFPLFIVALLGEGLDIINYVIIAGLLASGFRIGKKKKAIVGLVLVGISLLIQLIK